MSGIRSTRMTRSGHRLDQNPAAQQSLAMAVNPTLYKKIAYDPGKDFQPIAMVAHLPFILVVNPALPINSVADLIKYAKENPGKLSFGSGGVGASHHLYGEMFKSLTGV